EDGNFAPLQSGEARIGAEEILKRGAWISSRPHCVIVQCQQDDIGVMWRFLREGREVSKLIRYVGSGKASLRHPCGNGVVEAGPFIDELLRTVAVGAEAAEPVRLIAELECY